MDPTASIAAGQGLPPADLPVEAVSSSRAQRASARRERLLLLVKRPAFLIGAGVMLFLVIFSVLGEQITPYDPFNGFSLGRQPPSAQHLFGTDRIGRDVLSRVMVGSRDVLIVAPLAALLGVFMGTLLGLVMGFYRGIVDDILSR